MSRTKGTDLETSVALRIFSDNVPLSQCKPKELWKLSKVAKNGQSSEWGIFDRCFSTLNDLADAGVGRVPRQKTLHSQFEEWLGNQIPPIVWAFKDSDRAVMHIRTMLQSLQGLKRNQRPAPRNHAKLQIIVDKMVVDSSEIVVDSSDMVMKSSELPAPVPVANSPVLNSDSEYEADSESGSSESTDPVMKSLQSNLFGTSARNVKQVAPAAARESAVYPFAACYHQFMTCIPFSHNSACVPVALADHGVGVHVPDVLADHGVHVPVPVALADHGVVVPAPVALAVQGHVQGELLDAAALAALAAGCDVTTAPLPQEFTALKKRKKKAATAATSAVAACSNALATPTKRLRLREKTTLNVKDNAKHAVEAESYFL